MRLRHIEVFNAIMLTGSVSAAARLINITQPAVSRTLQHAELQLGFSLFARTKGRLTPTTSAPMACSRLFTSGSWSTAVNSVAKRSITGVGVPRGAKIAFHS